MNVSRNGYCFYFCASLHYTIEMIVAWHSSDCLTFTWRGLAIFHVDFSSSSGGVMQGKDRWGILHSLQQVDIWTVMDEFTENLWRPIATPCGSVSCLQVVSGSATVHVSPLPEVGEPGIPQVSNEVVPLVFLWFWSVELIMWDLSLDLCDQSE